MENNNINNEEVSKIDTRLKEIQDKIENEKLSLDESLDLYEEAVKLGMDASRSVEEKVLKDFNYAKEETGEEPEIEVLKEG